MGLNLSWWIWFTWFNRSFSTDRIFLSLYTVLIGHLCAALSCPLQYSLSWIFENMLWYRWIGIVWYYALIVFSKLASIWPSYVEGYSMIWLFCRNKAENITDNTGMWFVSFMRELLQKVLCVCCPTAVAYFFTFFALSCRKNVFFAWISFASSAKGCLFHCETFCFCDVSFNTLSVWMCVGRGVFNGGSCPRTQSAVGHDAAASSDFSVLTEDYTQNCCSSPFSLGVSCVIRHRYGSLYLWVLIFSNFISPLSFI